jgi:hypothetical protein
MINRDAKRVFSPASRVTVDQYLASVTFQREADENIFSRLLPGNGHILFHDPGIFDGNRKQEQIIVRSIERTLRENNARGVSVETSSSTSADSRSRFQLSLYPRACPRS